MRAVQFGNRNAITIRGAAIADLIPSEVSQKTDVAAGVAHMQRMMASYPPIIGIDTKALIEEGRH
ncbi:prevent-host-death protein [Glaciimonas sp. PAMC28666]|uniref:prevent-host-death protein n=1 Tax=Glaciimonas sp. PAMC28666 TaxID=2807626 RepID=UPI001964C65F|nr:prevent-host-death protein [Glaciimonas sp. PAMC28666]QRX84518.1 prevent-host-death protein [Glaciimonas sp. PAMC28666]